MLGSGGTAGYQFSPTKIGLICSGAWTNGLCTNQSPRVSTPAHVCRHSRGFVDGMLDGKFNNIADFKTSVEGWLSYIPLSYYALSTHPRQCQRLTCVIYTWPVLLHTTI